MGAQRAKLEAALASAMPPPADPLFGMGKPWSSGKQNFGRPAWEGLTDIPLDELEDEELRFANTRVRSLEHADRMQLQRDQIDRMAPLGTGPVSRPFANMAGDPTKRESIGENLEAFGENLGDLGREAMRAMPTGLPSQEEWQEGFRLAGEDFSGAQAGAQRAAQAAPGQVSRAAQAAPGALRLGGERLMANVMADPVGRELAAVAPLGPFAPAALPFLPNTRDAMLDTAAASPRVAGEIGRAVTYGPWEDERQLQYELDAARFMEEAGLGDPEQTRELADEGLRQTGWAGLNLAFAPLDVPVVARGAGAVASRLGGRQAAEAAAEAPLRGRRLGEPPVIEGEFSAVDAPAQPRAPMQGDPLEGVGAGTGRTVTGYHYTTSPLEGDFRPGTYFSTNPRYGERAMTDAPQEGAQVHSVDLRLQNPRYVSPDEETRFINGSRALIEEARAAGHDALVLRHPTELGDEILMLDSVPRGAPAPRIGSAADDAGSSTGAQEEWIDAYRGIEEPFDGTFRVGERNWYPNTVSASRTPDAANFYARKTTGMAFGEGANVMPVQARGPFVPREEFERLTYEYMGRGRWSAEKEQAATIRAVDELRRRGYRGITSDVDDEIAVFADEGGGVSNIRSRFDDASRLPEGSAATDPLGGISTEGARLGGSPGATTAAIGGTALGGAMLAGDEAEAQENAELGAAQAELDRLEALLRAAPANTRDMPAVETYQDALKREGYYGQGFSPDGDWGDGTDAAVEALRGDISAARERVEELELAERSAAAAPSDIEQAWRQWGPLAAFGGGVALAEVAPWGLGRLSATRGVRRRLEARNARADTLVNPEPLTQPGRSRASQIEANEEAATRAENINDFWRQGGASERVPFRTTRSGSQRGFTVNRDAADMSELFPPDGASRWRLPDLGYAAVGGVEAAALHPFVEDAKEELDAAQAAVDANPNPTLAELQRLDSAKEAFANTEALQRLGQGFAAGRLLAPTIHRYPNPQPNLAAAGAERTRLNQYLAPRRKPKK